jgi:hypothetical protein
VAFDSVERAPGSGCGDEPQSPRPCGCDGDDVWRRRGGRDGWHARRGGHARGFQYLVALVGVFTLCIAQERLFYFRTSLRLGEGVFAREDLSAPIVPKPYRCVCCWVLQSLAKSSQSRPVHCIHHVCRTLGTLCPSLTSVPPAHRVPLTKLHPKSVPNVRQRSLGTFLYGANLVSSYLVMLAVMTCNFGVFVSVVAGLASGHFLFASRRPLAAGPTNSEACHPEY